MYIKISIDDGKGKKADLEINDSDKLTQVAIINSVFELFGLDTSFLEKAEKMSKIEKVYAKFIDEVDPIEDRKHDLNKNEIDEQLTESLQVHKKELDTVYKEKNDAPNFVRTGIKIRDGVELYRLRYKCPSCSFKNVHYVYPHTKVTWCQRCEHEMVVYPAAKRHLEKDTMGNFFRAGEFMDWNIHR